MKTKTGTITLTHFKFTPSGMVTANKGELEEAVKQWNDAIARMYNSPAVVVNASSFGIDKDPKGRPQFKWHEVNEE